jgi:hypothetical protein
VDYGIIKRLWPSARRFGVAFIGAYLIAYGNIYIGSIYLDTKQMASFGLTAQVGLFTVNLASLWLSIKWPEITILRTQGREQEMARLFARRLGLMVGSFIFLAVAVLTTGNLLLAWKGTQTRLLESQYLLFFFLYLLIQTVYGAFGSLTCTANVMPFHRIALLTGLGSVTLSMLFAPLWGLWGMLIGPPLAELAGNLWFYCWKGFRSQPLTLGQLLRAMLPW